MNVSEFDDAPRTPLDLVMRCGRCWVPLAASPAPPNDDMVVILDRQCRRHSLAYTRLADGSVRGWVMRCLCADINEALNRCLVHRVTFDSDGVAHVDRSTRPMLRVHIDEITR